MSASRRRSSMQQRRERNSSPRSSFKKLGTASSNFQLTVSVRNSCGDTVSAAFLRHSSSSSVMCHVQVACLPAQARVWAWEAQIRRVAAGLRTSAPHPPAAPATRALGPLSRNAGHFSARSCLDRLISRARARRTVMGMAGILR